MQVVTRFAPSPTGFLHVGGARTALFNWLYAKNKGGKFLLRIEDTDKKRSSGEAIDAIFAGMRWMGLDWDDQAVYQSQNCKEHVKIANQLLDSGNAYKCYCSKEDLDAMRQKAIDEKKSFKYDGTWRNKDASQAPKDVSPVIRLKANKEGQTVINDLVQGEVTVSNSEIDDMILLRSDGTPTYMLSVVVDDHYMGVTDVIRGDDHLTNAFRQKAIYEALNWKIPNYAHIPLIHGSDGAKLSKRHGALGVEEYKKMGYLPEAMRNYLLRLGWSHGDDEIISDSQAIGWFDIQHIGKSPSRFDFDKLDNLNANYIKESDDEYLYNLIKDKFDNVDAVIQDRLLRGMSSLKLRAKNLNDLADLAKFYVEPPTEFTSKAQKALDSDGMTILGFVIAELDTVALWNSDNIQSAMKNLSEKTNKGLGKIMAPIRAKITGSHASPSMFEVMEILGKDETISRIG